MPAKPPIPEQQSTPHLPPGPPPLIFDKFQGINTSTTRPGVKDEEMAWCDGFFPIGPRFLRTMWDVFGPIFTTVGSPISWFNFCNIGTTPIMLVFHVDGSIAYVNLSAGSSGAIANAGTIQNPDVLNTGMTQWASQYVVIVTNQTDGYFIWDGTTFFKPGDTWTHGTGIIPTGVGGTTVETYTGRVWVANGPLVQFTAPGTLNDFATADGGGNFSSSDSFLRDRFIQLKQSNGFLYMIADSSMNYISGVQTSGSPPTTTFTNQNADPEVGSPWPGTVTTFGRNILFANAFGAHASYGAAITKISEQLDGVYNTVPNFGGIIPSAAKAIVFGKKVWILLLPIIDPFTHQQVNKLFIWNSKIWFSTPQSVSLNFIQTQELDSVLTAYGTDGTSVYVLFGQPSDAFGKVVQSRLWDEPVGIQTLKSAVRIWGMAQYYLPDSTDLTLTVDSENTSNQNTIVSGPTEAHWTTAGGFAVRWFTAGSLSVTWLTGGSLVVFAPEAVGQWGAVLGLTMQTNCSDMALIMLALQPEVVQYRG